MAVKRHVRGVGSKEQRQYEQIKRSAQRSGRYGKRAKEVAARTVLKQHKRKGHKKGSKFWERVKHLHCFTQLSTRFSSARPCDPPLLPELRERGRGEGKMGHNQHGVQKLRCTRSAAFHFFGVNPL